MGATCFGDKKKIKVGWGRREAYPAQSTKFPTSHLECRGTRTEILYSPKRVLNSILFSGSSSFLKRQNILVKCVSMFGPTFLNSQALPNVYLLSFLLGLFHHFFLLFLFAGNFSSYLTGKHLRFTHLFTLHIFTEHHYATLCQELRIQY